MVIENTELMHERCPQHWHLGTARAKRKTEEEDTNIEKGEDAKKLSVHEMMSQRPNALAILGPMLHIYELPNYTHL